MRSTCEVCGELITQHRPHKSCKAAWELAYLRGKNSVPRMEAALYYGAALAAFAAGFGTCWLWR